MKIRFVSQDLHADSQWTDERKDCVHNKIFLPLARNLKSADFAVSVHLGLEPNRTGVSQHDPRLEMWVVLQGADGQSQQVARVQGVHFPALTNELSSHLRRKVRALERTA